MLYETDNSPVRSIMLLLLVASPMAFTMSSVSGAVISVICSRKEMSRCSIFPKQFIVNQTRCPPSFGWLTSVISYANIFIWRYEQKPICFVFDFVLTFGSSISSAVIVKISLLSIESKSIVSNLVACAILAFSIAFLT